MSFLRNLTKKTTSKKRSESVEKTSSKDTSSGPVGAAQSNIDDLNFADDSTALIKRKRSKTPEPTPETVMDNQVFPRTPLTPPMSPRISQFRPIRQQSDLDGSIFQRPLSTTAEDTSSVKSLPVSRSSLYPPLYSSSNSYSFNQHQATYTPRRTSHQPSVPTTQEPIIEEPDSQSQENGDIMSIKSLPLVRRELPTFDSLSVYKPILYSSNNSAMQVKPAQKEQIRDQLVDEMTTEFLEKIQRDIKTTLNSTSPFQKVSTQVEKLSHGRLNGEQALLVLLGLFAIWPVFRNFPDLVCKGAGFAYPAWKSAQALHSPKNNNNGNPEAIREWLAYWIVLSVCQILNVWSSSILNIFPFCWLLECLFYLWLASPYTRGAQNLYKVVIRQIVKTPTQKKLQ